MKRLFSASLLSAIKVVSSAYLRLLIFLPAMVIPNCESSNPAFHIIYSVFKLNKQRDKIQPWCIPSPALNKSVVSCLVLTAASWPAYRFLGRQVKWSGIPISLRIFHSLLWPHSRRLYHSQWSRSRCFSGSLFLFLWSCRCWRFDLWFLSLF